MEDQELNDLLLQARPSASGDAEVIARQLAGETTSGHRKTAGRPRRRWRKRLIIPIGVGALALAGAGTVAAYQLSVPPFQTVPQGLERTTDGVPVKYRTDAGTRVSCQAFVEFRDVTDLQRKQVNAMITDTSWSGYGQRMYNQLPTKLRGADHGAMGEAVLNDLEQRALEAAPGTTLRANHGPTITGGAMSCSYPDGAPDDSN